jgi:carbon-monoxide dehydrogenase large subunit
VSATGIGAAVRRKEDQRFVTGKGHYTDDVNRPGQCYAYFLRSPHAHARIKAIDAAAATRMPSVLAVLTGAALAGDKIGNLICGWMITSKDGTQMKMAPHPALAHGKANHVGDAVAVILAETLAQARDAAEKVDIVYEPLPAVTDPAKAQTDGAPQIHEIAARNTIYQWHLGDQKAAETAFKSAHHVTRLDFVNNRLSPNAIEPRAAIGEYDAGTDGLTLWNTTQNPHVARLVISAFVGIAPENKLRVIAPDVGGGFGSKIFIYPEEVVCLWASRKIGRPVKWVSDRSEAFLTDAHGRDHVTHAEMAFDAEGKATGLRVKTIANLGAYMSTFSSSVPTYLYATLLSGQYEIPAIYCEVDAVYTNTVPVDAYRGAGRPEASYVIERLVDAAARDIGVEPVVLRRKNFVRPSAMPYETATGKVYDTGEFAAHMARAQVLADWDGFKKRARDARKRGKLRGIGVATYIEACGGNGPETATLKLEKDGTVTLLIGTQSTGQGHETSYAQIVADHFGLQPDQFRMVQGDTARIPTGGGTGGSSSIPAGGVSVSMSAKKLAENLKEIAADALEASPRDLEFADGSVKVAGTDRAIRFADLAKRPEATDDKLTSADAFTPPAPTYPNGTHVAEVEIDEATGATEIVTYVIVDDFGVTLNPLMLAGQVHGGTAQGIGQALMEDTVYDDDSGQLLTASFMDYALPRASHMPDFAFETRNVRCKNNPMGFKGAGEAGAIGSCPAVMNAILDALWRSYNIRHLDMPATAPRIWAAIEEGKRSLRM